MQLLGEKFFLKYLCIIVILSFLLVETLNSFIILSSVVAILFHAPSMYLEFNVRADVIHSEPAILLTVTSLILIEL